jgi:formylglycine-generating enzyme required for sulfatase activity
MISRLGVLALATLMLAGCSADAPPQSAITACPDAVALGERVWIPAGETQIGSNERDAPPEERPAQVRAVEGFWIDRTEVTNAQFAAFVEATGYVTQAERAFSPSEPAGSAVFTPPDAGAGVQAYTDWWRYVPGADWRHPEGPGSSIEGRERFPVVHVTVDDARAYADWAGGRLPSETEWERAARAGGGSYYLWGNDPYPDGQQLANTWQGMFPFQDTGADGHLGAAPVGCFPANGFGLFDMAGNVWELTLTAYAADPQRRAAQPDAMVIKGGSFLCAPNYCGRFRPAARQPGDRTLGTNHTGFRLVYDDPPPA